jgi:hypothetical protein
MYVKVPALSARYRRRGAALVAGRMVVLLATGSL